MCPQSRKFRVGSSRGSSRDAVLENRVRVYRDRVHLNYSKIRVNSSFPRFLSIIDYNSNIEAILMNRSRKISSSSRLKVLELDIFRDRGQRPRSNSPMAGPYDFRTGGLLALKMTRLEEMTYIRKRVDD